MFYCYDDGNQIADAFDTAEDAASFVRDHGGWYRYEEPRVVSYPATAHKPEGH